MAKKLSKLDWLQAGFLALTKAGPQALKAEPLAKSLKVSKGSFYWHFKDIDDYKSAMITHWAQAATADVITRIKAGTAHPIEKLYALAHHSTTLPEASYGGHASESAIRDWARYDPQVAAIVTKIDARRIAFTEALFLEAGQGKTQARQSARLLYSALIGLEILAATALTDPPQDLSHLVSLLLKQP